MEYDVIIIGAGICGCSLAFELSRYKNRVLLLDKENDVSEGTTKANSGIVHAGYDPEPGTLMAKYNVLGNSYIKELAEKLSVPYRQTGSLVVAFGEEDERELERLLENGLSNGVRELSIIGADEAKKLEPNLNGEVTAALWAKTAAVISPWELCLALAETAVKNGVELKLECEVRGINKTGDGFEVETGLGSFRGRFVVNAAGVEAASVNSMAGGNEFKITPQKGEYFLLDKSQAGLVEHVIFRCPGKEGKGVLVSPTAHGNIIAGPDAKPAKKGDVSTSTAGLEFVRSMALKSVPGINFRENIRNFAGLRAVSDRDDFIFGESEECSGLFNMAGIKSPGLTSAPAMARDMAKKLIERGLSPENNENFTDRRSVVRFKELSDEKRAALIEKEPAYGRVICRCETITLGEIEAAFDSPIPPRTVDGVKRRCGTGMGRCQGGFCGPRVHEILAERLGVSQEEILLDRAGSYILSGRTKQ